ncbi:MAG: AMP-binding protein, partial [Bacteroidota bacterium]
MNYENLYSTSLQNPEKFWETQAQAIPWFEFPQQTLSQDEQGFYRWYAGGKINLSYLALDFHIEQGRGDQLALIYDSPVTQTKVQYTFSQLKEAVARFAGLLKAQGIVKGDRVVIYMPMIPQAAIAMLACARLGAIHSVVFGGFAAHELALRIDDARPKLILSASCGIEFNKVIPYKPLLDQAQAKAQFPAEKCIIYQRDQYRAELKKGQDLDWEESLLGIEEASYVALDAQDPLYILYTSGTTGKPKGILRDNGGYAVALKFSMDKIYNTQPGEVYWAASDVGWVVGHSYIVYGPLIQGCTSILFEGKPIRTPDASTFWRIMAEYQVNTFFTAPTAFRAIKKEDPKGLLKSSFDLSALKYIFLAGERCDISTYEWVKELAGVPVIDHWWQTESGWPMLANMMGLDSFRVKPGAAGRPVCGYDIRILDEIGNEKRPGEEGAVAIKLPLPPGCLPSLWQDENRFRESYLSQYPGYYLSGDGGFKDEDGFVFI